MTGRSDLKRVCKHVRVFVQWKVAERKEKKNKRARKDWGKYSDLG